LAAESRASEVGCSQRLQREAALSRFHRHAVFFCLQHRVGVWRECAQYVLQLLGRNSQGTRFLAGFQLCGRPNLNFKIGCQETDGGILDLHQHVGEDRQRVPPLYDPGHLLQWA
jgi:hypothetical protein